MSPNQYVSDLRAEVAALRATVARVEELAVKWRQHGDWIGALMVQSALDGTRPSDLSTDSDPAATERQGEAEGAGDGV